MSNLKNIYKQFVNLGVFSRILLVIVKPLALWLSIQLDADEELLLELLEEPPSGTQALPTADAMMESGA